MLTFPDLTIEEQIRNKGLEASTFVAQSFWQEMQKGLYDMVQERLKEMREAEHATPDVKARLLDRWLWMEKIAARIERIPQAAIEAARELGDYDVRQGF